MTTATVRQEIINNGGNAYVAAVLTSEEFIKYFNANKAEGLSDKQALSDAFASCQKDTLAAVTRPEVINYVAERTYREIRAAHGLTTEHKSEYQENALLEFFN